MKKENDQRWKSLSEKVIYAAIDGDETSIKVILNHYSQYINKLAAKHSYDIHGNLVFVIDPYLRLILETHLVKAILNFKTSYK